MYSIGLDISKATIDIFIPINKSNIQISNNLKSIKCFIVNPKKSINFAKAIGQRNKSDIEDAIMLSKMIVTALDEDIRVPIVNSVVEELHELISYYKLLLKQRTQYKNHLESISIKNPNSIVVKNINKEIKSLNLKIDKLINNILTIKGVGDISAIVLLHHFIKYPNTNQKEIVSLAGLDPISKSSGTSIQSRAKISKAGSKLCRATLFMAVMVAVRFNDELKDYYDRLKERGKHTTVTQIAVMRKIIIIAHSLYKNNEKYDGKKYKLFAL